MTHLQWVRHFFVPAHRNARRNGRVTGLGYPLNREEERDKRGPKERSRETSNGDAEFTPVALSSERRPTVAPTITRERPITAIPQDTQLSSEARRAVRRLRRRERLDRIHRVVARVVLGGIALQVLFAGIAIFGVYSFLPHQIFAPILILGSFSLPVLAHVGHLDAWVIRRSWLLAGLMIVQGLLIDAGRLVQAVSALHPVNAMLLVIVTYTLAVRPRTN